MDDLRLDPDPGESTVPPGCQSTPELLTEAQLAATPRERLDVEWIAMQAHGTLTADEATYQRARCELDRIAALLPRAGIPPHPWHDRGTGVSVFLDRPFDALPLVAKEELACLNASLGVIVAEKHSDTFLLYRFAGLLNPALVQPLYEAIEGVEHVGPATGVGGDGNETVLIATDDGAHRYVFFLGSGDCPSGCISREALLFRAEPSGEVLFLDEYEPSFGSTPPDWFVDASARRSNNQSR